MSVDFTIVLGVDKTHASKLSLVWRSWIKVKPSILERPLVIFYDAEHDTRYMADVWELVNRDHDNFRVVPWPRHVGVTFPGDATNKWHHPQRYKMLAGFVHTAARCVETKYWLKIDLDTVACDLNDWVDDAWFDENPVIVSHPWGYTKPADQMQKLDQWVCFNDVEPLAHFPNLNLNPNLGSSMIRHKRIISWCAFFQTEFTQLCSSLAQEHCGEGQLPVPSQDGFMWYVAKRLDLPIVRVNMKKRGWEHWTTMRNIRNAVARVCDGKQNPSEERQRSS